MYTSWVVVGGISWGGGGEGAGGGEVICGGGGGISRTWVIWGGPGIVSSAPYGHPPTQHDGLSDHLIFAGT